MTFRVWNNASGQPQLLALKKVPLELIFGSELYDAFLSDGKSPITFTADKLRLNSDHVDEKDVSIPSPLDFKSDGLLNKNSVQTMEMYDLKHFNHPFIVAINNGLRQNVDVSRLPSKTRKAYQDYIERHENADMPSQATLGQIQNKLTGTDLSSPQQQKIKSVDHTPQYPKRKFEPEENIRSSHNLSSVFITPNAVNHQTNQNTHAGVEVLQELIESLQGKPLDFDTNNTSIKSHKIQVSLIEKDGSHTYVPATKNADLVSIVSNKPTVVNHIYQLGNQEVKLLAEKLQPIKHNQTINRSNQIPSMSQPTNETIPKEIDLENVKFLDKQSETDTVSSNQLEGMESLNKILSEVPIRGTEETIRDVALKGILTAISPQQAQSPEPIRVNSGLNLAKPVLNIQHDLETLEELLKNGNLSQDVEILILSDILSGATVSQALSRYVPLHSITRMHSNKIKNQHKKSPTIISPLKVIEQIDNQYMSTFNSYNKRSIVKTTVDSSMSSEIETCLSDKACTFALSIAVALGTNETASSAPETAAFNLPETGRSVGASSYRMEGSSMVSNAMDLSDANRIIDTVTRYSEGVFNHSVTGRESVQIYMTPFFNYLGHKIFPERFG